MSFSYSDKPLYDKVTFVVGDGQKVGLVGPNGSGKSTLLAILMGREDGYNGKIKVQGSLALVPQEVKYDPDMESSDSIRAYVDPKKENKDYELAKLFSGLGLSVNLSSSAQNLSGGQKTKLALARALLSHPDILLLDEPTNFMDAAGKEWVMTFLGSYKGTLVVISHDLELMDNRIDKVLAINPSTRSIEVYKGTYSDYVRLKAEHDELVRKQVLIKQMHIKKLEKGLSKMVRFTSGKGVRRKTQQRHRIEKEKKDLPALPQEVGKIKVSLPEPAKVGELPIRAINISKSYENGEVLSLLNFTIVRGERIVLIGPNGSGKSTLLKILIGVEKPDSGEVIQNPQLKIGYYSQEFEVFSTKGGQSFGLDFEKTLLDTFIDETKKEVGFARAFLGRYMFLGDKVFQKVKTLSGGEKTRLSIAILTAKNTNLLILDEPTTYLDLTSQRIILTALKEYKGSMIVVSHTPQFIEELAPQKAVLFPGGKMVYWAEDLLAKVLEI